MTVGDGREQFRRGHDLLRARQVTPALSCFVKAQESGYDAAECAAARWDCWMLRGDFEQAWKESDFIHQTGAADPHRMWTGESWRGRRIMLRCLHGLGDTIQFIRYASLLRADCARLVVQTHPQLVRLLEAIPAIDEVLTWGEDRNDWDLQMEINELPRAFRTTLETIPTTIPYVTLPSNLVAQAAQYVSSPGSTRVGLCWRSGPWDPSRSVNPADLSPLFEIPGIEVYNLQKDATNEDRMALPRLRELELYARDVRDTAAAILNLDLVITVDTVTAHIAGAVGKPVWILLPHQADWRWMIRRDDSPWYPTARLFRSQNESGWPEVISRVREALTTSAAAL
jgi:hypothetical protein